MAALGGRFFMQTKFKLILPTLLLLFGCRIEHPLLSTLLPTFSERTVYIHSLNSPIASGTGWILNSDGDILTCYHFFLDPNFKPEIHRNGKVFSAHLARFSSVMDLAILKSDEKYPALRDTIWEEMDHLAIGQEVFLLGAPFGLEESLLKGYISNPVRKGVESGAPEMALIQTAGLSYPGNSGAVVFNEEGKIIGMQRAAYGFAPDTGIGLVVPASAILFFLKSEAPSR